MSEIQYGYCSECGGGMDGMYWVPRESITPEDGVFYRLGDGTGHDLYVTCWACNPRRVVPPGYTPVDAAWIRTWLAAPCQCNDCKRERGEPYWRQRWSDNGLPLDEYELVVP